MTRILLILCMLIIILVLLRFVKKSHEGFEGFENEKSIIICKAEWCGHCKEAAPEFKKLVSASPITLADGSKASVKMLDADEDKEELKNYDIKGFPTVLILNNGNSKEYPGPRTSESIIEYMNSQ